MRIALNLWPPFLFTGICITELSDDFRTCRVKLRDWPGTRNVNGTQYGGSLFSMTDPIFALMLLGILGPKYYVWDKSASIDFENPGNGPVWLDCSVTDATVQKIQAATAGGEKYFPELHMRIYDNSGVTVATVHRTLYVRLKPQFRPTAPAR